MSSDESKACDGAARLIFACSGAADVGEVSDRAARRLMKDDSGRMFCLAGIGGGVEPILKRTEAASRILAIDGCDLDCTKKCLEAAGFDSFEHLRITDLGFEKGKTMVNEQNVHVAVQAGAGLLG